MTVPNERAKGTCQLMQLRPTYDEWIRHICGMASAMLPQILGNCQG